MKKETFGALAVTATYVCWGLLTVFWNLLNEVNSMYILTQRIVWSMVFMGFFMAVCGKWKDILPVFKSPKKLGIQSIGEYTSMR